MLADESGRGGRAAAVKSTRESRETCGWGRWNGELLTHLRSTPLPDLMPREAICGTIKKGTISAGCGMGKMTAEGKLLFRSPCDARLQRVLRG